ncbi:addiction module antidote protein [Methylobacterium sp. 17Sr1-1]|uniref:addiction module antidote protein n=1 Tax=Methylobacterium sp. 17Sr1-1 TaxID=2202826 RepID=UPI000D6F3B14|nr:addiction module antidote protein [Methylobacterium sp. 17Sr1-1]AWN54612.1 putative addiction module antidote protein [Methylobacterium sp. 17Sr1-1]
MPLETRPHDTAEHLKTDEGVALYIEAALEDGDPALIRDAIGIVARARGRSHIAREAGLSRESLYKALSQAGNPSFETVRAVLQALGLQFSVKRADKPAA